jgi:GT2 family glycosyltransferase
VKLFSTAAKPTPPVTARHSDIQAAPAPLSSSGEGATQRIKIDAAYRFGASVMVAGWCSGDVELGLSANGVELDTRHTNVARQDVAEHLQLPKGDRLGFVLVAEAPVDSSVSVIWEPKQGGSVCTSQPLKFSSAVPSSPADLHVLGPAMGLLALAQEPHSKAWANLITRTPTATVPCRTARAFLEGCAACELTRDVVVVGWVVHAPGTVVWLEDEAGHTFSLDGAFRRFRQDVHDAVGHEFGQGSRNAGFVARLRGIKPGSMVRLKAVAETGVHVLGETACTTLPLDPVSAARWLFAVATPLQDMHRRVPIIDEPVLGPLIQHRQTIWDELPVHRRDLGKLPDSPAVSVIVPLYGRSDFVEHQLIEFAADPWFKENVELVYVIDDPKLVDGFGSQAETLHRLYRLPFRWIWGSVNRGFSGANNLGARHSSAPVMVFLNSDAFPQAAGWLQPLIQVLSDRPDIGAVGPRLVFADGSIQHAGMEFQRREELGAWVNHHPCMGLDPQLDPHRELSIVPSVTGACMALRRVDFDRLGGWDTGYLVGDFEDSDLCLKLRSVGLNIAYLPTVQLTHLERQSFKLLGQDEFRTRVVLYNAVRHQTRWAGLIDQPVRNIIEVAEAA